MCARCGKDFPWYMLFPRKSDKQDVCTGCATPVKSRTIPVVLSPRRKSPLPGDPEIQRLIARSGKA